MNALINIRGTVLAEEALPDVIEIVTAGRYYTKDGKRYISYLESDSNGLSGVTTTLKIEGDDSVTLIRNGTSQSRLVIAKGKRQLCHYGTGYGDLMVGISGCHINSSLSDAGGELSFNYTIDVNSSLVSKNEVFISVREEKKQDVKPNEYSN